MTFTVIQEEDLKRHVNGLQLIPRISLLKPGSVLPLSSSSSGYYVPLCNASSSSYNNGYKQYSQFLVLNFGHSSVSQILFIKHYDHLTESLVYVGSITGSQNANVGNLIDSICAEGSLLPTLDPKQIQLILIGSGSSLSELGREYPNSLPHGSTVLVADKSVPLSKLQSFPAIGKVLERQKEEKPKPITEMYRKMLHNEDTSDLVLKVEDHFIYVSSHILICQCTYFQTALTGDFAEKKLVLLKRSKESTDIHEGKWPVYSLPDLAYNGVMACLEWIYTGEITMLEKAVKENPLPKSQAFLLFQQTYVASDYFGTDELSKLLCPRLPRLLNELNFGDAFEFSTKYGLTDLGQAAVQFMKSCAPLKKGIPGKESPSGSSTPTTAVESQSDKDVDREELIQMQFDKVFEVIQQSGKTFRMFFSAIV